MKSGFSSSKLSERPTSESIPGITGDGRRWFIDDFYETVANIYGGANNLFGAFGGAETNDNNAMQAMFNHNNDGSFSLGSGSSDTAIITTDPYEGDFHFAIQGALSYVGNLDVEVNWLHKYFMEGYVKSVGAVQSALYMGFYCRDADGNFIDLRNCGGQSNTTLSQDLEDGDTYAFVTDASVFSATSDTYYFRNLLFFPPNHAKYFRPWWHTRIGYGSPTMYYSERDTSNNKLRLSTNGNTDGSGDTTWSGGFIPAGTPVSRGVAGGTYNYCISGGGTISTSWAQLDQTVNGNGYPSRNSSCTFRQGTKYIRPMTLNNYGQSATSALYIDNWRFINLTDPGQSSPGEYSSYSKAVNNIQGARITEQGHLLANDLNEIVLPGHGGVFSYGNSIYKSSNLKLEIDPEDATTRGGITSSSGAGIKAAGGTLNDLSGNSNNMNIEGNPYMGFGTSKHDGSGDNLYRTSPSWTDYMTFGCWLKIASGQDNGGQYWFMDSNRSSGSVSARIYSEIVNGSGSDDNITFKGWDNGAGGSFTLTSTSAINDGVWHYIVAVWEKTSKRLYFDGRLEASTTQSGASDSSYSSLQVGGAYFNSAVQDSINGQVGPFHMYTNEALSDDQIYHNYNYFWESRYRWLSDSTVGAAINATNNSITY
tara:strand:- start:1618 stop:3567 length:1950 start_codon:yes stop_codon:yes gene_type:complete